MMVRTSPGPEKRRQSQKHAKNARASHEGFVAASTGHGLMRWHAGCAGATGAKQVVQLEASPSAAPSNARSLFDAPSARGLLSRRACLPAQSRSMLALAL